MTDLLFMFCLGVATASFLWYFQNSITRCQRDGARADNTEARAMLGRTLTRLKDLGVPENDRLVMDAHVTLLLERECR